MTLLFSKVIDKDPVEFVARMRYVLDPEMTFYREYCLKSSETFQLVFSFHINLLSKFCLKNHPAGAKP